MNTKSGRSIGAEKLPEVLKRHREGRANLYAVREVIKRAVFSAVREQTGLFCSFAAGRLWRMETQEQRRAGAEWVARQLVRVSVH